MKTSSGSIAPKERVNIAYQSSTNGASQSVELPLKMLVLGDFTGRRNEKTIEQRETINVNQDNMDAVMEGQSIQLELNVPNKLAGDTEEALNIQLDFKSMKDFLPTKIAEKVPELKKLVELRKAVMALKGPLGNLPTLRRTMQDILKDESSRNALKQELITIENQKPKA